MDAQDCRMLAIQLAWQLPRDADDAETVYREMRHVLDYLHGTAPGGVAGAPCSTGNSNSNSNGNNENVVSFFCEKREPAASG